MIVTKLLQIMMGVTKRKIRCNNSARDCNKTVTDYYNKELYSK